MITEKSCGAILYNEKGEILLLKHRSGNHYDFCKGHIEKHETEKECAIREVKEETGLDIEVENGFKAYSYYTIQSRGFKQVCWFTSKVVGDVTLQNQELLEYGWYPFDEAFKKITYPSSKIILSHWKQTHMTKL